MYPDKEVDALIENDIDAWVEAKHQNDQLDLFDEDN